MAHGTPDKATLHGGVTLRAVLVAVVLVAFLSILSPYNDEYRHNTLLAGNHFPIAAFFLLFLLTLVGNGLLGLLGRVVRRSLKFEPVELLVIWILTVVASGVPSSGLNRYLTPVAYAPFYHKTPENEWREKLCNRIHDQLVPSTAQRGVDYEAVEAYHEGLRDGGPYVSGLVLWKHVDWAGVTRQYLLWSSVALGLYVLALGARRVVGTASASERGEADRGGWLAGIRWGAVLRPMALWAVVLVVLVLFTQLATGIPDEHTGLRGGRDMGWGEVVLRMPWGSLWRPFVFWTILVLAVYLVMFSVCMILARQWTERENLQFPLLQLPHELVETPEKGSLVNRFLRSRAMWVGAALPICVHLLNGMRVHFPKLPQFPMFFNIDASLTEPFWRYFRPLNIHLWFSFIGVAFLLNKKVSLSFWFFFIFMRLQFAMLFWLGYLRTPADRSQLFWNSQGGYLPEQRQVFGAQFMWFLFILWLARRQIWAGLRRAFRPRERGDAGWYTADFWAWSGLVLGVAVALAWCRTYGISLWAAASYLVLFLVTATIATRLICQAGLIFVQFNYTPVEPLFSTGFTLGGATAFSPTTIVMLSVVNRVFAMDIREVLMPSLMQGMKIGDELRARRWRLYLAIGLVLLVALPLSFFAFQIVVYRYGGIDIGWWTFRSQTGYFYSRVVRALPAVDGTPPAAVKPVWWELFYMGVGMVLMAAVILLHRRFVWWPIHPAGYCTANAWAMYNMWFPFFVGWLSKVLVLRYGGPDAYKRWRDYFLGLIFGDMLMGGVWTVVNFFWAEAGQRYNVLPM